jgi:hypothetical protein
MWLRMQNDDRKWKVESGKWKVESGKWKVEKIQNLTFKIKN